jgi:hypothetical protein
MKLTLCLVGRIKIPIKDLSLHVNHHKLDTKQQSFANFQERHLGKIICVKEYTFTERNLRQGKSEGPDICGVGFTNSTTVFDATSNWLIDIKDIEEKMNKHTTDEEHTMPDVEHTMTDEEKRYKKVIDQLEPSVHIILSPDLERMLPFWKEHFTIILLTSTGQKSGKWLLPGIIHYEKEEVEKKGYGIGLMMEISFKQIIAFLLFLYGRYEHMGDILRW